MILLQRGKKKLDWSRNSITVTQVEQERAGLSGFWGSIPYGGWEFFSKPPRPVHLWGPPSLLSNVYWGFLPWE
jgi:hypothetical protein